MSRTSFGQIMGVILVYAIALAGSRAWAEPPAAAEVKELQARFVEGRKELDAGRYEKALELFQLNLDRDPDSKGSLLFSGLALLQLQQWDKAGDRLDHFLKLEPANEAGLMGAIRAKQSQGRNAEVEALRARLLQERVSGNPKLKVMLAYERQFVTLPDGARFSVLEAFDDAAGYVWSYVVTRPDHKIYRRLEVVTAPPGGNSKVKFMLGEMLGSAEKISGYKIHRMFAERPLFEQARDEALKVVQEPSKGD